MTTRSEVTAYMRETRTALRDIDRLLTACKLEEATDVARHVSVFVDELERLVCAYTDERTPNQFVSGDVPR